PAGAAKPQRTEPHPRIRERRVAVRRDAGRRRLKILIAGSSAAAAVGLAYGATRSPLLDVDTVRVEGAVRTDPDQARRAGLLDRRQLADIDPARAAARIEALPWVQRATVVRHWPGTVQVSLLERTPVAAVPAPAQRWALVDVTGRVLAHEPAPPVDMPTVDTTDPVPAPGERVTEPTRAAVAVLDRLPPALHGRVIGVRLGTDRELEVTLAGGPPVRFGPVRQVQPKLVALATLLDRTELRGVTAIDVRVPTAPVLTRR
ncbi:MAG: FtsQ-type POTRA domain-containing protein, partial [Actinobacteria bacterium]|nr:FtsQ-type POTRA domain-containing protein [Actinomycetota bacterium]